jgi:hypothetical protein
MHFSISVSLIHNEVSKIVNFLLQSVHSQSLVLAEVLASFLSYLNMFDESLLMQAEVI